MKSMITILALALGTLTLTACQGSSNSTPIASTYANNCVMGSYGTYVSPTTGGACNTSAVGQCVQTMNGYINQYTGQPCSSMGLTGAYSGYGSTYGSNACAQAYGPQYQPAYINGQLSCVGY